MCNLIRLILVITVLPLCLYVETSYATDLLQVYHQALQADPDIQIAKAQNAVTAENIAIKRADLLPNLSFSGSANEASNNNGIPKFDGMLSHYELDLNQVVFDYGKWLTYTTAKTSAKSAAATYAYNLQDLILRTANAYFAVAEAKEKLVLTKDNNDALKENLRQTKLRFQVGLAKTTDVNNANAAYDSSIASVEQAKLNLVIANSELQAMIGTKPIRLQVIKNELPLITPKPLALQAWLARAKKRNLNLLAAHYDVLVAEQKVGINFADNFPTLQAEASYSGNRSFNNGLAMTSNNAGAIGGELDLPIFEGGKVMANTQQARYEVDLADGEYLKAYRNTVSQTQQSFSGVLSDISQIRSNRLAVRSNRLSLASTEAAYKAGTRNMMDVLQAQQTLFNAELNYVSAKYKYLNDFLGLKQAAGMLTVDDLKMMNKWLI